MNSLPYYRRYARDFLEGTAGMPLELKGPYAVLLDLIYLQSGQLPDDPHYISGHLGCSVRMWNGIRKKLIAAGKISVSGGVISNFRADKEQIILSKYQDKQRENRSRPNKNNDLTSPKHHHTDTDIEKRDTNVSQKKKRGTRLPENWVLPLKWGEWAIESGWSEYSVRTEADRFRDYWIAKTRDATKLDWEATWRNWMRSSKSPKVINGGGNEQPSSTAERLQRTIAAAAAGTSGKDWG